MICIGSLGIPSILISMVAGRHIEEFMTLPGPITIHLSPNNDDQLTKAWSDLAFTTYDGMNIHTYVHTYIHTHSSIANDETFNSTDMSSEDEALAIDGLIESYVTYGSQDILSWLERKKGKAQSKTVKTVSAS